MGYAHPYFVFGKNITEKTGIHLSLRKEKNASLLNYLTVVI